MEYELGLVFLGDTKDFIKALPFLEQEKLAGAVNAMRNNDFQSPVTKQLKGNIKELKIRKYRFIFFVHDRRIFFTRAFLKKTNKTPKKEIELSEKIYKIVINN